MNDVLLPKLGFVRHLTISLRLGLIMSVLCGVIYMVSITQLGAALFPLQAGGSVVEQQGVIVGSSLIAQPFADVRYFYGRPSAANDDPKAASGSNLAPSNPALRDRVLLTSEKIQRLENVSAEKIPVDLLSASGSGLDPHITPESAFLQAARVAKSRGMDEAVIIQLIKDHIEAPQWGVFGQERVNVLELNLALNGAR